jgi:hypothetical protein
VWVCIVGAVSLSSRHTRLRVCAALASRILRGVASSCLKRIELMLAVTARTWVIELIITFSIVVAGVMDLYFLCLLNEN